MRALRRGSAHDARVLKSRAGTNTCVAHDGSGAPGATQRIRAEDESRRVQRARGARGRPLGAAAPNSHRTKPTQSKKWRGEERKFGKFAKTREEEK